MRSAAERVRSVRELTYDILRSHGMTTVFGNPGSNELPFLKEFPADFRYVHGLHEGAVISMADGYAQATGRPVLVNLHAAAGTGNAMGGLTNAVYTHSPLVIVAGQQVRSTVGMEVMLANVAASALPAPLVKWSAEPLSAHDVARTVSQAIHTATLPPSGPVYVSVPYDDWDEPAPPEGGQLATRTTAVGNAVSDEQLTALATTIGGAARPVLVLGPDVDADCANAAAVRLAERIGCAVWIAPSPSRCPFPTGHTQFRGVLPASVTGISATLAGHDLIVVAGAPVFRYHQHAPGNYLPSGARLIQLTVDPGEAARAPVGDAVVAPLGDVLERLGELVPRTPRTLPQVRPRLATPTSTATLTNAAAGRLDPDEVFGILNDAAPEDAVYVVESTSTHEAFWNTMRLSHPGSLYSPASGGLGFGIPAAVGVQLAHDSRRVYAVIGDGSANFGITGLWTAAQLQLPVVFLILNNGTYAALRWFSAVLGTGETPGMDVPGIDFVNLARGYGVPAEAVSTAEQYRTALDRAAESTGPVLIEIRTGLGAESGEDATRPVSGSTAGQKAAT